MKKLTNESKARFFAQYYGQKVLKDKRCFIEKHTYPLSGINLIAAHDLDSIYLELTPLQNISDDHAIEVAKIITNGINQHGWSVNRENKPIIWVENSYDSGIDFNISNDNIIETGYHVDIINYLQAFEFLKSKSYTTPHYCPIENRIIPVQEQIDNGWITLKNE